MACDRIGCEHIMCDRLILDNRAYICNSCWEELLEHKRTWPAEMTKLEVRKAIENFMYKQQPGTFLKETCDVDEEFERLTGGS